MLQRVVINAISIAVATAILPQLWLYDPWSVRGVLTMLIVGALFGILNAVVRPLFKVLTGCIVLLTFGLFLFVINATMLVLTAWVCRQFGLAWHLDFSWTFDGVIGLALATLIVSFVSFLAAKFIDTGK
ncbi:MAG: phage holin family protein [Propionibacteriaceae bacterium]|jgi:putative membrane protein|nr:phage holin family protein [Propionibacteriaceae bacterium]